MMQQELNCAECLRYASEGATKHHPFCPEIAVDKKQAEEDYRRGWRAYCGDSWPGTRKPVERDNIKPEDAKNAYFMMGYNVAFSCDDGSEDFRQLVDLHLNEFVA